MLTGKLVRVRIARNKLVPLFIDANEKSWRDVATHLLELFRGMGNCTRGELEEEIEQTLGDNPTQLVHQGLAKLLEDRCEFEIDSDLAPETIREKAFLASVRQRKQGGNFNRDAILAEVAQELSIEPQIVELGLFADLKSEQRLMRFQDCTPEQLLHRYNEALAQAILLRSTGVTVQIYNETAARFRQIFRAIKFHRLICEIVSKSEGLVTLNLDGPLSLFSSTQKYGMQLACFLPTLLQCKRFELKAVVRWGTERKEKDFALSSGDGLRSHTVDHGDYIPKEITLFSESFQKTISDWELEPTEPIVLPSSSGVWVPDFKLIHRRTGQIVPVEILGFWRQTDAEKLYQRLAKDLTTGFVLAVSEQFNLDENLSEENNPRIYRFKRTPLPEEIARRAQEQLSTPKKQRKPTNG